MDLQEKYIRNLLRHRIPKDGTKFSDDYKRHIQPLCQDVLCYAEHDMIGSTHTEVDLIWTPYALLAKSMSINEVNEERKKLERRGRPGDPRNFGFEDCKYIIHISLGPVNPKTLEVPLPRIIRAVDSYDGKPIPKNIWKDSVYQGKYKDIGQIILKYLPRKN